MQNQSKLEYKNVADIFFKVIPFYWRWFIG